MGTLSPGRTLRALPFSTASTGTSSSLPSRTRWAVLAARFSSPRMAATSARLSQLAQPDWNLTTDRLGQKHQRDRISVEGQRQNGRSASGAADGAAGYHNVAGLMQLRDAR